MYVYYNFQSMYPALSQLEVSVPTVTLMLNAKPSRFVPVHEPSTLLMCCCKKWHFPIESPSTLRMTLSTCKQSRGICEEHLPPTNKWFLQCEDTSCVISSIPWTETSATQHILHLDVYISCHKFEKYLVHDQRIYEHERLHLLFNSLVALKGCPILQVLVEHHTPSLHICRQNIFQPEGWRPTHLAIDIVIHIHSAIISLKLLGEYCPRHNK